MNQLKHKDASGLNKSQSSTRKRTLIGVAVAAVLGFAAFIFYKRKSSRVAVDVSDIENNRQNRTDDQLVALAQSIHELYSIHKKSLTSAELRDALQEFLNLEQKNHSHEAFRIIETRLAVESQKPLEYGKRYGLYGFATGPDYLIK